MRAWVCISEASLPFCVASSAPMCIAFSAIASPQRISSRPRSVADMRDQGPRNALAAAVTARSTWSAPAMAKSPQRRPVVGLKDSKVRPGSAATASPAMCRP